MKMRRNMGEIEIFNKKIKLFSGNYYYPQRNLQFIFKFLLIFFRAGTHFAHRRILNNSPFSILFFNFFSRMLHSIFTIS